LANCGIIKLEKVEQEYRPLILYDQIVLDFPVSNKGVPMEKPVSRPTVQV
jgi:predicted transcriptional regulator